jgi:hypothetical protein
MGPGSQVNDLEMEDGRRGWRPGLLKLGNVPSLRECIVNMKLVSRRSMLITHRHVPGRSETKKVEPLNGDVSGRRY